MIRKVAHGEAASQEHDRKKAGSFNRRNSPDGTRDWWRPPEQHQRRLLTARMRALGVEAV